MIKKRAFFFKFPIHNINKIWGLQYTGAMLYIRIKIVPFIHVLQDLVYLMARLMKLQMTNIYPIKQKGPLMSQFLILGLLGGIIHIHSKIMKEHSVYK